MEDALTSQPWPFPAAWDALCRPWQLQWECAECTVPSVPARTCQHIPCPVPTLLLEGISSVPDPFPSGSLAPFQRTAGAPLTPQGPELYPEVSLLLQKLLLKSLFPDTFLIPWIENYSLRLFMLIFSSQLFPATCDFTLMQRHYFSYLSFLGSPLATL